MHKYVDVQYDLDVVRNIIQQNSRIIFNVEFKNCL